MIEIGNAAGGLLLVNVGGDLLPEIGHGDRLPKKEDADLLPENAGKDPLRGREGADLLPENAGRDRHLGIKMTGREEQQEMVYLNEKARSQGGCPAMVQHTKKRRKTLLSQ